MKKFVALFLITGGLLHYSCLNRCDVDCVNPPMPLRFKVVDAISNSNLITNGVYVKDSIKIFYFDGSVKEYANIQFVGYGEQFDIIETNVGIQQPLEQLNTFYIYLNHTDIDTILVRFIKQSDGCCTSYPLDSIAINGKYADFDNTDYTFLIKK